MDRRQLLKGLAALPLARLSHVYAAPPLCGGTCTFINDSLLVWLEGAFAVVLNRNKAGDLIDVTAFSPVDADHLAKIASLKGAYPDQFHLTLQKDGIVPATKVCISPDFGDFCEEQLGVLQGNVENAFVRLKLPLPNNIYTTERLKGKLAGKRVCIPQDHVLEYQTIAGTPNTLYYEDKKQSLQTNLANRLFHIEVGLDATTSDADAIAHAKRFHNKTILAHFGWQNNASKQITNISSFTCDVTIPKEISARLPKPPIVTTTLECKSGGIIGGSLPPNL